MQIMDKILYFLITFFCLFNILSKKFMKMVDANHGKSLRHICQLKNVACFPVSSAHIPVSSARKVFLRFLIKLMDKFATHFSFHHSFLDF